MRLPPSTNSSLPTAHLMFMLLEYHKRMCLAMCASKINHNHTFSSLCMPLQTSHTKLIMMTTYQIRTQLMWLVVLQRLGKSLFVLFLQVLKKEPYYCHIFSLSFVESNNYKLSKNKACVSYMPISSYIQRQVKNREKISVVALQVRFL